MVRTVSGGCISRERREFGQSSRGVSTPLACGSHKGGIFGLPSFFGCPTWWTLQSFLGLLDFILGRTDRDLSSGCNMATLGVLRISTTSLFVTTVFKLMLSGYIQRKSKGDFIFIKKLCQHTHINSWCGKFIRCGQQSSLGQLLWCSCSSWQKASSCKASAVWTGVILMAKKLLAEPHIT